MLEIESTNFIVRTNFGSEHLHRRTLHIPTINIDTLEKLISSKSVEKLNSIQE